METGKEEPGPRELVRLAIPRRVYTQSHVDYIIEVVEEAFRRRESLKPFRFLEQAPFLKHFTARYGMVERPSERMLSMGGKSKNSNLSLRGCMNRVLYKTEPTLDIRLRYLSKDLWVTTRGIKFSRLK